MYIYTYTCKSHYIVCVKNRHVNYSHIQIRRPISTVFEILVPTFAILLLIVLRCIITYFRPLICLISLFTINIRLANVLPPTDVCFLTFEPDSLTAPNVSTGLPYNIYFTPNNAKSELKNHTMMSHCTQKLTMSD